MPERSAQPCYATSPDRGLHGRPALRVMSAPPRRGRGAPRLTGAPAQDGRLHHGRRARLPGAPHFRAGADGGADAAAAEPGSSAEAGGSSDGDVPAVPQPKSPRPPPRAPRIHPAVAAKARAAAQADAAAPTTPRLFRAGAALETAPL